MRSLRVGAICVLAALFMAPACDGGDGDGGGKPLGELTRADATARLLAAARETGNGGLPTAEQFCQAVLELECASAVECGVALTVDDCLRDYDLSRYHLGCVQAYEKAFGAERRDNWVFDRDLFAECVEANSRRCGAHFGISGQCLNEAGQGQLAAGEPCVFDFECAGDRRCSPHDVGCEGVCRPLDACNGDGGCNSGWVCGEDGACAPPVLPEVGEPCSDYEMRCAPGAVCEGTTCAPWEDVLRACEADGRGACLERGLGCGSGGSVDGSGHEPDTVCHVTFSRYVPLGGGCSQGLGEFRCAMGLSCDPATRTCVPAFGPGADCSEDESVCGPGLVCGEDPAVCIAPPGEGEACDALDRCAMPLRCVDDVCIRQRDDGETCEDDAFCASGRCRDGVCVLICD